MQHAAPYAEAEHAARQISDPAFGDGKLRQHLVILIGVLKRAGHQGQGCIGFGDLKQGVLPFACGFSAARSANTKKQDHVAADMMSAHPAIATAFTASGSGAVEAEHSRIAVSRSDLVY